MSDRFKLCKRMHSVDMFVYSSGEKCIKEEKNLRKIPKFSHFKMLNVILCNSRFCFSHTVMRSLFKCQKYNQIRNFLRFSLRSKMKTWKKYKITFNTWNCGNFRNLVQFSVLFYPFYRMRRKMCGNRLHSLTKTDPKLAFYSFLCFFYWKTIRTYIWVFFGLVGLTFFFIKISVYFR